MGGMDTAAELGAPIVNCYLAGVDQGLFEDAAWLPAEYASTAGVTIVYKCGAHDASGPVASVSSIAGDIGTRHSRGQYDPCSHYQVNEEIYPEAYDETAERRRIPRRGASLALLPSLVWCGERSAEHLPPHRRYLMGGHAASFQSTRHGDCHSRPPLVVLLSPVLRHDNWSFCAPMPSKEKRSRKPNQDHRHSE